VIFWKKKSKQFAIACLMFLGISFGTPPVSHADFFGGDLPLLAAIVANTIQQISELQSILGKGSDTLGFLRDINSGLSNAMMLSESLNRVVQAGIWGNIQDPSQLFSMIQATYGFIPQSQRTQAQQLADQTIAESLLLHNAAFSYADAVDPQAEQIKSYSLGLSPLGAERQTASSLGVLIHVNNQLLRTQAATLKVMSEQLALQNSRDKLTTQQFLTEYQALEEGYSSMTTMQQATQLAGGY
jgi:hypothetical protein